MDASGTVYLIRAGESGPVKIGWTGGAVAKRMKALQTGSHEQLHIIAEIPAGRDWERALHESLSQYRLEGEWFALPEERVEEVMALRKAADFHAYFCLQYDITRAIVSAVLDSLALGDEGQPISRAELMAAAGAASAKLWTELTQTFDLPRYTPDVRKLTEKLY